MNDVRRPSKTLERAWGTIIRKDFMLCKWVCTVWEKKSSKRESSWAVQLWGKFLQGLAREELPADYHDRVKRLIQKDICSMNPHITRETEAMMMCGARAGFCV